MFKRIFNRRSLKVSLVVTSTIGLGVLGYFIYKNRTKTIGNGPLV